MFIKPHQLKDLPIPLRDKDNQSQPIKLPALQECIKAELAQVREFIKVELALDLEFFDLELQVLPAPISKEVRLINLIKATTTGAELVELEHLKHLEHLEQPEHPEHLEHMVRLVVQVNSTVPHQVTGIPPRNDRIHEIIVYNYSKNILKYFIKLYYHLLLFFS